MYVERELREKLKSVCLELGYAPNRWRKMLDRELEPIFGENSKGEPVLLGKKTANFTPEALLEHLLKIKAKVDELKAKQPQERVSE